MAKARAKCSYEVICELHGCVSKDHNRKVLKVSRPENKKQKTDGCPLCRREHGSKG